MRFQKNPIIKNKHMESNMSENLEQKVKQLREQLKNAEDELEAQHQAELDKKEAQEQVEIEERRQAYLKKHHNVDLSDRLDEALDLDRLPTIIDNEYIKCDLNKIKTELQNLRKDQMMVADFNKDGTISMRYSRVGQYAEIVDKRFEIPGLRFDKLNGFLRLYTRCKAKLIPMGLTELKKGTPYDIDLKNLPDLEIGAHDHKINLDDYKKEIGKLKPGESLSFGRDPGKGGILISYENDVSRSHFDIKNDNGKLVLVDNSTFGTRVIPQVKKDPEKTVVNMTNRFPNKIRSGRD